MSERYIIGVDQSTSGTKALLFDGAGRIVVRKDLPHRQIISPEGWVSHDPMEIYRNTVTAVRQVLEHTGVHRESVVGVGISNQRETCLLWDKTTGLPVADAVVWQCARGSAICDRLREHAAMIHSRTGLPLSPYFSAAKLAWILENTPNLDRKNICCGTIDSWLVYKLTGEFRTDWSNASRTQLLDLTRLCWDEDICGLFGIPLDTLPEVCDSDSCFGYTDFEGLLPKPVPVHGVMGDSHGALFGQGCHRRGMVKATYGTGTSVMANIGRQPVFCPSVVTSLAWGLDGEVTYVLEGNINYSGAVIRWLVDDIGLLSSAKEAGPLAAAANPEDTTYLVPAFSGLGSPHWDSAARATIQGMTRSTRKAELVRAAEECIAYQITDVIRAIERESDIAVTELRVDGGATRDRFLMQFQSDITDLTLSMTVVEELSAVGVCYAAGLALGLYDGGVFDAMERTRFVPAMDEGTRRRKYSGWQDAVRLTRSQRREGGETK